MCPTWQNFKPCLKRAAFTLTFISFALTTQEMRARFKCQSMPTCWSFCYFGPLPSLSPWDHKHFLFSVRMREIKWGKTEACFDDCISEVNGKVTRHGLEPISNSSQLLAHGSESDPNMMSLSSSGWDDGQLEKKKADKKTRPAKRSQTLLSKLFQEALSNRVKRGQGWKVQKQTLDEKERKYS